MSEERLNVGDHAPDALVLDVAGREVHLASLWAAGSVMLNFVRHFG